MGVWGYDTGATTGIPQRFLNYRKNSIAELRMANKSLLVSSKLLPFYFVSFICLILLSQMYTYENHLPGLVLWFFNYWKWWFLDIYYWHWKKERNVETWFLTGTICVALCCDLNFSIFGFSKIGMTLIKKANNNKYIQYKKLFLSLPHPGSPFPHLLVSPCCFARPPFILLFPSP